MKLKSIILFGLLFSISLSFAQNDFRSGYIIKKRGDTLYGKIDYRGDFLMSRICKFKDNKNVINKYSPNDILAYRFTDSKYYVSREINKKQKFLEYLIKGKVNIYYLREDIDDHYYLDKKGLSLTEIPYEEGIKYVDNKQIYYETTKHLGILYYSMQDAPQIQSKINNIKKPEHRNLIKLAKNYHNTVSSDEDKYIVYEKEQPLLKVNLEIVGGFVNYKNVKDLNETFYIQSGVLAHFWMPRENEKMYFKTGVLFSKLDFNNEKNNLYRIPFHLEYIFPKGIFRPRFSYGLNFYQHQNLTNSFDFGTNIKLTEKLFLSVTSDIEFNNSKMLIVPKSLLSYSLKLGIFMEF